MRKICTVLALFFALTCSGLAAESSNPYQQYYKAFEMDRSLLVPFQGEPELLRSAGDFETARQVMFEKGFLPIGASEFQGAPQAESLAVVWARTLGASHVLLLARPVENGAANSFVQTAAFFAPAKRIGAGLMLKPLADDSRARLGIKEGVLIFAVRRDSAAGKAGLQSGDIALAVNGEPAASMPEFIALIKQYAGQENELTILRNGQIFIQGLPVY